MDFSKVKAIVEGAFNPHRCVAEEYDYGYLRFQVTTEDGKRWTAADPDKASTEKVRNDDIPRVRELVQSMRDVLKEKGYQLEEWSWREV